MDERDNHFERCTDSCVTMIWQQPLDAEWSWVTMGNAVRSFFFLFSISVVLDVISFFLSRATFVFISTSRSRCNAANNEMWQKSRTKVHRWFWLDQLVIMKHDKSRRLFHEAKMLPIEQDTPYEIENTTNIWMCQNQKKRLPFMLNLWFWNSNSTIFSQTIFT